MTGTSGGCRWLPVLVIVVHPFSVAEASAGARTETFVHRVPVLLDLVRGDRSAPCESFVEFSKFEGTSRFFEEVDGVLLPRFHVSAGGAARAASTIC